MDLSIGPEHSFCVLRGLGQRPNKHETGGHRPLIIRGQLSEQFLRHGESGGGHGRLTMWLLGNLLTNVATQPDFIAYRFSDRENLCLRLCHKVYHVQEVNWTIRAKEEMEAAEQAGNLVILECFDPEV